MGIRAKPPKEKVERLHKFVTLMRQLNIRRLMRGKTDTHYAVIAPTGAGKGVGIVNATLLGGWRESLPSNGFKRRIMGYNL